MAWTYSGNPAASYKDAVRFEIQDTLAKAQLLTDEEIEYTIAQEAGEKPSPRGLLSASARCCEVIARKFSAQADTVIGSMQATYSKMATGYRELAKQLRQRAMGAGTIFVGAQSRSEKRALREERDREQPIFRRHQFEERHRMLINEPGFPEGFGG